METALPEVAVQTRPGRASLRVVDLGRTSYRGAWELQRRIAALRTAGLIGDALVLNEHDHVYTFGRSSDEAHLLAGGEELARLGADVVATDRGGDVTYHGPGQLVGYPILALAGEEQDLHAYLRRLEETIIRTLAAYGIAGTRDGSYTGVWVGGEKIAAIGVRVSRWVTMHGFALNVTTDLAYFNRIIPCGIFHRGVTSIAQLLGRHVPLGEVAERLTREFAVVFGREPAVTPVDLFMQIVERTEQAQWHR